MKYVAKFESQTQVAERIRKIVATPENLTVQQILKKTLLQLNNRDFSSQEIAVFLLGDDLVYTNKIFAFLNTNEQHALVKTEEILGKTDIEHYLGRPSATEGMSFFQFFKAYRKEKDSMVRRSHAAEEPVIVPLPRTKPTTEEYYHQQYLLHEPFNALPTLAQNETWKEKCATLGALPYKVILGNVRSKDTESAGQEFGHFLSQAAADENDDQNDTVDFLRSRMRDFEELYQSCDFKHYPQYDWCADAGVITERAVDEFYDQLKASTPVVVGPSNNLSLMLSQEQRVAYDCVIDHWGSANRSPLKMIVQAGAGCGKSFLINSLKQTLGEALVLCAFTGCAAHLIRGQTISSLFSIPVGVFDDIAENNLRSKQVGKIIVLIEMDINLREKEMK